MRKTFVIPVEGVIRKVTDGQPIVQMVELISSFAGENTFIYLTDEAANDTADWLNLHGLGHTLVLGRDADRLMQLRRIQHEWGYNVDFVIEPDPEVVAKLVEHGYPVLAFFHPYYSKREWRPDYKFEVTPWDDIKEGIVKQQAMRANDSRTRSE